MGERYGLPDARPGEGSPRVGFGWWRRTRLVAHTLVVGSKPSKAESAHGICQKDTPRLGRARGRRAGGST